METDEITSVEKNVEDGALGSVQGLTVTQGQGDNKGGVGEHSGEGRRKHHPRQR